MHLEEAQRQCKQCEAAIAKNQFSNATSILACILEAFGKAGLDEDEREAAVCVYMCDIEAAVCAYMCVYTRTSERLRYVNLYL